MIGRLYDAGSEDREVEIKPGMDMPTSKQLLWIDVGRGLDELKVIDELLELDGTITALETPAKRPQITNNKRFARIRVIGIEDKKKQGKPAPLAVDVLAMKNVVVTVHDGPVDGMTLPLEFSPDETELGYLDESAFTALMLDGILTGYFRAVERIEARIDKYDERALQAKADDNLIEELVAMRAEIAILRRALNPQREVFVALERPGLVLSDEERAAWPLLGDRFRQAVESVQNARELLVGTFDIVISQTGQRTNDVMRVLTVVSSVLLPAVVIAGIMGMNFKAPLFDDPSNFYIVLFVTAAIGVAILVLARWRHWI